MNRDSWTHYPGLKVALVVATGMLLAHHFNPTIPTILPSLSAALLLLAVGMFLLRFLILPSLILVLLLASGLWYQILEGDDRDALSLLPHQPIESVELIGRIGDLPVIRSGSIEWEVEPDSILFRNLGVACSGRILLKVWNSDTARCSGHALLTRFEPGEVISARGRFVPPSPPRLPGEFDYAGWLASRGIVGSLEVRVVPDIYSIRTTDREEGGIETFPERMRRTIRAYAQQRIGGEEGEVARALFLGERGGIDRSIRDQFALTGTAHVLAVSGLHVGVIALALFVLVTWFPGRWIRLSIFAVVLGFYVMLVGAPPSILRAGVMAVLFLTAYNVGRIARPLNTLGLAGLLILIADPSSLFTIGFQLSFAAVGGILLCYGPTFEWLIRHFPVIRRWWLLEKVVQLLLLSCTAQLLTTPLTLHYFGQISPLSPLINLVVVPLITIGFGAGVAGLLAIPIPLLSDSFASSAWLALHLAIEGVKYASTLPLAGLTLPRVGTIPAVLGFCFALYLARSRSARQVAVRVALLFLVMIQSLLVESRLNSFRSSSDGFVYLVPITRTDGIAVLLHHDDTLTVWYDRALPYDSSAVERISEKVADHTGARHVAIHQLGSARSWNESGHLRRSGLQLVNSAGPEYLSDLRPLLLTNSARRPLGRVRIDRRSVMQAPLQGHLDRTLVLEHQEKGDRWREVEWK